MSTITSSQPPARTAGPVNGLEAAQRADLAQLKSSVPSLARSFDAEAKAFERGLTELEGRVGALGSHAFLMEVARLVALANDGHTEARVLDEMRRVPVRFTWFDDGLFVTQAAEAYASLLGAEVLAIGGCPVGAAAAALDAYIPGTAENGRALSPAFLSSPDALAGAGLTAAGDSIGLSARHAGGQAFDVVLPAQVWHSPGHRLCEWRNLVPGLAPDGAAGRWRQLLDGAATVPVYLQHPERPHHYEWLEDGCVYLRLWTTMHDGERRLDDYLKGALNNIADVSPRRVIIDLRFNTGGMFSLVYLFCAGLAAIVGREVPIYVVTSCFTFSAGIYMTGLIKRFGGERVRIVGQKLGDGLRFWAEGDFIELPNSGLRIAYADGFFDLTAPAGQALPHRYWMNSAFATMVQSLEPDIKVPLRFGDYVNGIDACLSAIDADEA